MKTLYINSDYIIQLSITDAENKLLPLSAFDTLKVTVYTTDKDINPQFYYGVTGKTNNIGSDQTIALSESILKDLESGQINLLIDYAFDSEIFADSLYNNTIINHTNLYLDTETVISKIKLYNTEFAKISGEVTDNTKLVNYINSKSVNITSTQLATIKNEIISGLPTKTESVNKIIWEMPKDFYNNRDLYSGSDADSSWLFKFGNSGKFTVYNDRVTGTSGFDFKPVIKVGNSTLEVTNQMANFYEGGVYIRQTINGKDVLFKVIVTYSKNGYNSNDCMLIVELIPVSILLLSDFKTWQNYPITQGSTYGQIDSYDHKVKIITNNIDNIYSSSI